MLWKGLIILFCMILLPLCFGSLYKSKSFSLTYLAGALSMWAFFQIVAVPAIQLRISFSLLFWVYTALVVLLSAIGFRNRLKIRFEKPEISIFLIVAIVIILYQAGIYFLKMHLDEDDARWLAEANDALVKDKMLLHNPATGEYIGRFVGEMVKDTFSPWPFFVAWLSRMTDFNVATIAHTIYPPFLLSLSYCAYYLMGRQLFKGKAERGIFLIMVAMIHMFMGSNSWTQSAFTLKRIWQGKAVVAAVIIPAVLMIILLIQNEDQRKNWILLAVTGCAAALLSGMGIAIGLLMIGVYGGYVVLCKRWKRIPLWILSMVPSAVFGIGYYLLRG